VYIYPKEKKKIHLIMVRPPSFLEDSLSADKTNTSFSTVSSESGEFTISQSPPTPTDIQTDVSSNRNPYVEQYLNIYYKKSLDQSVN
jgi:hypothetical protein